MSATRQTKPSLSLLDLEKARHILEDQGFTVSEHQPYLSGERFLMAKNKLVIAATYGTPPARVVVKISNTHEGQGEIRKEKRIREVLTSLAFAKKRIAFPKEAFFHDKHGHTIWATEFIEQEKVFVAHPLEDQFFMALRAFEDQEAFHATTFEHAKIITSAFEVYDAKKYQETLHSFIATLANELGNREETRTLTRAEKLFREHEHIVDRYDRFLTHTDFVPHNFRIKQGEIYLLDCSAVHFGNKYEGWARFLNYMVIHNPALEQLLARYVRTNRGDEEYLDLRLLRIYKVGHLLAYYARSVKDTAGNLRTLTEVRIKFWNEILKHLLEDTQPKEKLIASYHKERDALRSPEEKERQKDFAIA